MKLSTICYIEQDDKYLMLHRIKKHQDVNEGKWIGVGGKMEAGESPDECIAREVLEETGLTLVQPRLRGIITFISAVWDDELIFLYTGQAEGAMLPDCDEGVLRWVPIDEVDSLNLWAGDRVFLRLLRQTQDCFSLKLSYQGDDLIYCALNGADITAQTLGE